jgi:CheY-like chemotaxis protein
MELNRVLIVDDDPAIRRVVSALLDLDEYGLLEAAEGQAALEVVKVERPDLVILDLTMPRLDGLRACQEVADGAGSQFDPMVVDAFTAILLELPGLHAALHAGPVDSLAHSIP